MQLLYHTFIVIVKSFNFENLLRDAVHENYINSSKPGNSKNIKDSSADSSVKTRKETEMIPRHTTRYRPYSYCDTQHQSNMLPSTSKDFNSGSSISKNFSFYQDKNLVMKRNQINLNFLDEVFENSPTFSFAPQNQNDASSDHIYSANEEVSKNHLNEEKDANSVLDEVDDFAMIENEQVIETGDKILQDTIKTDAEIDNTKKENNCNLSHLEILNSSDISSLIESPEVQDYEVEMLENSHTGKSLDPLKRSTKLLLNAMYRLSLLEICEAKLLNYSLQNETYYSIFYTDLKKLNEATEYVKKLCITWIENEDFIEDSLNNRNIFESLLRLTHDIAGSIGFFEKAMNQKISTESVEILNSDLKILKQRIKEHNKSIEKLKLLGIDGILGDKNTTCNLIASSTTKVISFIYHEENSYNFKNFEISIKKAFYPVSLSVFEDSIFLCIYSKAQNLKILNVNFEKKQLVEIDRYLIIEGVNKVKRLCFGYGSKYTIIRSSVTGKLFILNSCPRRQYGKAFVAKKNLELLVVDEELKKLASIQVGKIILENNSVRPAIFDFVIHNDIVYALDMECKCIKVFNDLLILLKTIPIPDSVTETQGIHLAVSTKFIIIGTDTGIFYCKNNNEVTAFDRLELDRFLLNIAFYDEEYIVLRFKCGCYSLKMEENLSAANFTYLPALDQLKYLTLTNFMIKDNFVYSICAKTNQIFIIRFILNASTEIIQ